MDPATRSRSHAPRGRQSTITALPACCIANTSSGLMDCRPRLVRDWWITGHTTYADPDFGVTTVAPPASQLSAEYLSGAPALKRDPFSTRTQRFRGEAGFGSARGVFGGGCARNDPAPPPRPLAPSWQSRT